MNGKLGALLQYNQEDLVVELHAVQLPYPPNTAVALNKSLHD
jgi:hypothetical protein